MFNSIKISLLDDDLNQIQFSFSGCGVYITVNEQKVYVEDDEFLRIAEMVKRVVDDDYESVSRFMAEREKKEAENGQPTQ